MTRGSFAYLAFVIGLLGLATWLRLQELDGGPGYDEGVNGAQLLLMSRGHALYQEIYGTQGPLFLFSLFPFFQVGGQTLEAARLGSVFWSLLGLVAAALIGLIGGGRVGSVVSLALLTLSPIYLAQSRVIQSESAAIGPVVLSVACALRYLKWGRVAWLIAGSTLLTISILIKPLTISAAAVFAVAICVRPGLKVEHRLVHVGCAVLPVIALVLLVALMAGPRELGEQLVRFHLEARDVAPLNVPANVDVLRRGTEAEWPLLMIAVVLGITGLTWRAPRLALALGAWVVTTVVLLLTHTPLFGHHVVALIPPIAALAAGLGPQLSRWRGSRLAAAAVCMCLVGAGGWVASQQIPALLGTLDSQPKQPMLDEAANALQQLTDPDDYVLTDHPAVALLADRSVIPELADLSRVRIGSGLLSDAEALRDVDERQPRVAAIWFEYLQQGLPDLSDQIKARYTPVWGTENGRYLATLGDGGDLPAAFLDGYRSAGRPRFGGVMQLQSLKHAGTGRAGANLDVRLLWSVDRAPSADWTAVVSIRRNTGSEAGQTQALLGDGWAPTSFWRPQTTVGSYLVVPLLRSASGSYRVFIELRNRDGTPVPAAGGRVRGDYSAEISSLDVEP